MSTAVAQPAASSPAQQETAAVSPQQQQQQQKSTPPPTPTPLESMILVKEVKGKNGATIPTATIAEQNDYIILYFAASWVPQCIMFNHAFRDWYMRNHTAKRFEVIYVSLDKDDDSFALFYGEMPWLTMQGGKAPEVLGGKMGVRGLPTLVVLDNKGRIITKEGRMGVMGDPNANGFPWAPMR